MENLIDVLFKPDNIPIGGMLILSIFFGILSFYLAWKNDRIKALQKSEGGSSENENNDVVDKLDVVYPPEDQGQSKDIHCWPYLTRLELLCTILVLTLLIVWSITVDAPLEQPANPSVTPNPAKAPWYFLGLQDMLVYFDPWIAGVVLPILIIAGLMAIPYVDAHPDTGNGFYTLKGRMFPLLSFWFGYFVLWVILIVIGTFLRGPGWLWFWPWEKWDPHRVVAETNVNLNELLARIGHMPALLEYNTAFIVGMTVTAAYYILGTLIPYIYLKKKSSPTLERMGIIRYLIVCFFFWSMMALPIKMGLRLGLNIKYIWVTPWFNI